MITMLPLLTGQPSTPTIRARRSSGAGDSIPVAGSWQPDKDGAAPRARLAGQEPPPGGEFDRQDPSASLARQEASPVRELDGD